jgi:hypothetical protein
MVDLDRMHVYTWDARPHPAFPADTVAWGDGPNWRLGHWLTGRIAAAPLGPTVRAILEDHGFTAHDTSALHGTIGGLVVDRVMSARDAIQPLELAFFFDTRESEGRIVFAHRAPPTPSPASRRTTSSRPAPKRRWPRSRARRRRTCPPRPSSPTLRQAVTIPRQ